MQHPVFLIAYQPVVVCCAALTVLFWPIRDNLLLHNQKEGRIRKAWAGPGGRRGGRGAGTERGENTTYLVGKSVTFFALTLSLTKFY